MRRGGRGTCGFTLVELIACLALLALAAGTATLSMRGRSERAALLQALDQVSHADHMARQAAARRGLPAGILFDLDRGTVTVRCRDTQAAPAWTIDLPAGVRIEQVYVNDQRIQHGRIEVPCSIRGQTPTYAVQLGNATRQQQWRLITGLAGQHEDIEHAQDIEQIIKLCQKTGDDPD